MCATAHVVRSQIPRGPCHLTFALSNAWADLAQTTYALLLETLQQSHGVHAETTRRATALPPCAGESRCVITVGDT
jgi:hypothetical protein